MLIKWEWTEKYLNIFLKQKEMDFMESAVSRIISSAIHAERRSEEMEEVVEMLSENQDPVMCRATLEFFKSLSKTLKNLKKDQIIIWKYLNSIMSD